MPLKNNTVQGGATVGFHRRVPPTPAVKLPFLAESCQGSQFHEITWPRLILAGHGSVFWWHRVATKWMTSSEVDPSICIDVVPSPSD